MKTILKTLKWILVGTIAIGSAGEIIRVAHAEDICDPVYKVLNGKTGEYLYIYPQYNSGWCLGAPAGAGNPQWTSRGTAGSVSSCSKTSGGTGGHTASK